MDCVYVHVRIQCSIDYSVSFELSFVSLLVSIVCEADSGNAGVSNDMSSCYMVGAVVTLTTKRYKDEMFPFF